MNRQINCGLRIADCGLHKGRNLLFAMRNARCAMPKSAIRNPQSTISMRWSAALLLMLFLALASSACSPNMSEQPKYKSLAKSAFFPDQRSARAPVKDAVARGNLRVDESFYQGKVKGELIARMPVSVTRRLLERGQERFNIFCSPCHGRLGDGEGMVTRRGLRKPPSYHIDRLREAPDGHFFDVITNGFGAMTSYASRIPADDRWAIIAYVRALQFSQGAKLEDIPPAERQSLGETTK